MRLLLDTHALLWDMAGDTRLSPVALTAMKDPSNQLSVSMASLWEVGIKAAQGRLTFEGSGIDLVLEYMRLSQIDLLPVTLEHIRAAVLLPFHHGDPFDRMLVAQANVEAPRLVSNDAKVRLYDVDILW